MEQQHTNKTMSDTPRTDEWLAEEKRNPRLSGLGPWLGYCQQLERELAEAKEHRDRLAEALNGIIEDCSDDLPSWRVEESKEALSAVKGGTQ
jgi:hypothetical protein